MSARTNLRLRRAGLFLLLCCVAFAAAACPGCAENFRKGGGQEGLYKGLLMSLLLLTLAPFVIGTVVSLKLRRAARLKAGKLAEPATA